MKDENVLCVSCRIMNESFDMTVQHWKIDRSAIDKLPFVYLKRCEAEMNFEYKQIIPYAVFMNHNGEILCYQRHGSEKRLLDIYSVGIGGHVNDRDGGSTLSECLVSGLCREVTEEVGLSLDPDSIRMAGMINEEITEVGHCHTGVVFVVKIDNSCLSFDSEIGNPQWLKSADLDLSKFELWSGLALQLIFDNV